MKSLSVVVFAAALSILAGCAADPTDTASESSTQDVVSTTADVKLTGAYKAEAATSEGASFVGIVFNNNDGHFFADVNTGAGDTARISGTFVVSGRTVTLAPVANATDEWYGVYNLTLGTNGTIGLSRPATVSVAAVSPSNLGAEPSYCAAAVDCAGQNLVHPMCAPGGWKCGAESACAFSCGN